MQLKALDVPTNKGVYAPEVVRARELEVKLDSLRYEFDAKLQKLRGAELRRWVYALLLGQVGVIAALIWCLSPHAS